MPIILHDFLQAEGEFAIWEIEDHTLDLFEKLELTELEKEKVASMSLRRKKEWIAARWLIHKLSGRAQRGICLKDEYGKPYLEDSPYKISISHSIDKVAVIASPYNVGIDIQEIVEKMQRISVKFINNHESNWTKNLVDLHLVWGAKEAMYKAWGKKGIDFKADMNVKAPLWKDNSCTFSGSLVKKGIHMHFDLKASLIDNFVLVYAIEKFRELNF